MFESKRNSAIPEESEGQKYFSQMSPEQQQLLREILTALKQANWLDDRCDPQKDALHNLLRHNDRSPGICITDIAVGPGVYSPSNELAQDAVRYGVVPANVGEQEIQCTYVVRYGSQGRCQTLTFKRLADNSLTLAKGVVHEMWG